MNDLSPATTARADDLELETRLVHAGTLRSDFGETSEALFLTQGFVYPSAEAAEARFKGEEPGYVYSRYANPTTRMFEERMMALEGAEDARATASGMAAISTALPVAGMPWKSPRCVPSTRSRLTTVSPSATCSTTSWRRSGKAA